MSTRSSETMKAIQVHTFGGPDVLTYDDVSRPVVGLGEVLIRVHAAGVNPGDWKMRSGLQNAPEEMRAAYLPPLPYIPGWDVSGVVEEVGPEVGAFREGDAVYGLLRFPSQTARAYAEYVVAPATDLARKPARIDHVAAAAMPMVALTAWQALFEHAGMEAGQTVLVNGAAGGVGHFAVQLAKARGARVIGVASGRHEAFLRELGVDHSIDYTATAVEKAARDVDLVIDMIGGGNQDRLLDVLKRGGKLIRIVGGDYSAEHAAEAGVTVKGMQVRSNGVQLGEIGELVDAGRVRVAIDTVVPLAEAYRAHERAEEQHIRGKIVLRVVE
jgi:NADPH:quinone reductase-like Zn-dependent oxidoreductase